MFSITLTVVLLAGLAGMLAYGYAVQESQGNPPGNAKNLITAKIISGESLSGQKGQNEKKKSRYEKIIQDAAYREANRIYVKEPAVSGEIKLLFAGDILFDPQYAVMASAKQRGGTVEQAFSADLLERMRGADIMMLNNEFPYTAGGTKTLEKQYTFRANPETAVWLRDMGVDMVSLANNHTFDFGEVGLQDTLSTLKRIAVPWVGAGQDIQEASSPSYFIIEDTKIAIVAATQIERLDNPDTREATDRLSGVFRCWNPGRLLEVVAEAKANSDFVVVYIHWGTENVSEPDWSQMSQAPEIAKAGADLIIGAHPHCLQGITYCGKVPVIYSLGNFWFSSRTVDTGLVEVILKTDGIQTLRFVPALQSDCSTKLLYDSERERVLERMRNLSPGVQIDGEGMISCSDSQSQ